MGAAEDVAAQFINDRDKIKVYDGAGKNDGFTWAQLPDAGWWAWDIRGWIKALVWDLLRFQKPIDFKTGDPSKKWGARDSLSRQHLLAEQNNFMLRKICRHYGIDLDEMPGE